MVLIAGSHRHFCVEQAGNCQIFSRKQVQSPTRTFELVCHRGRYCAPAEHLNLFRKLQHRMQGLLSLNRWQRQKRSRQSATRPTNDRLAQAQIPTTGL